MSASVAPALYHRGARPAVSSRWPSPPLFALALVVVVAVAVGTPNSKYPLVPWLFGIAVGGFVLILHRHSWLLLPFLLTELSITYYMIPHVGLSLRLAEALVATAVSAPIIAGRLRLDDDRVRRVVVPTVVFVALATIVNLMTSDTDYVLQYFRYLVSVVLVMVVTAAVVRDRDDVKRIATIALIIGVVSAFAAVSQHYASSLHLYGAATAANFHDWKGRSLGLMDNPVLLGNGLLCVVVPILGVIAAGPWKLNRSRVLLAASAALVGFGMYLTYTRSSMLAAGVGLVVIGLMLRGRRRVVVLSVVLGLGLLYQLSAGTGLIGDRYYETASDDRSAASHQALWDVGLAIALDHPLIGIGHEHFEEVSLEYQGVVDDNATLTRTGGANAVGHERPHNDFVSTWESWGVVALVAYLALFLGAIRNFVVAARDNDVFIRGMAVGCAGGLMAYAANSAFHNSFDSSVMLWLYAGLSIALAKLPIGLAAHTFSGSRLRGRAAARRPLSASGRAMHWS